MFVNPITLIEKGLVTGLFDQEKQVQPNAIDFTVDAINVIEYPSSYLERHTKGFWISETKKVMAQQTKELAHTFQDTGETVWDLDPHTEYDIYSNVYVEVPEGYAAMLFLRSTFVRNGCWLAAGLYDSGFKGNIGCVLHTGNNGGRVSPGTRIGQIAFIESGTAKMYAGGYNTVAGQHWTEKQ